MLKIDMHSTHDNENQKKYFIKNFFIMKCARKCEQGRGRVSFCGKKRGCNEMIDREASREAQTVGRNALSLEHPPSLINTQSSVDSIVEYKKEVLLSCEQKGCFLLWKTMHLSQLQRTPRGDLQKILRPSGYAVMNSHFVDICYGVFSKSGASPSSPSTKRRDRHRKP